MDDRKSASTYSEAISLGCEISDDEAEDIRQRDQAAAIALHAQLHRRRPLAYLVSVASAAVLTIQLRRNRRRIVHTDSTDITETKEPTS